MFYKETIVDAVSQASEHINIPVNLLTVSAGGALVLLGKKKATNDIDIEVSTDIFNKLWCEFKDNRNSYMSAPRADGKMEIIKELKFTSFHGDVDIVKMIIPRIRTQFTDNIRHRTLDSVVDLKRFLGRPKDIQDIINLGYML